MKLGPSAPSFTKFASMKSATIFSVMPAFTYSRARTLTMSLILDASRMSFCSSSSLTARHPSTQSDPSTTVSSGHLSMSGIRNRAGHSLSMPSLPLLSMRSAIIPTESSVSLNQTSSYSVSGTLNRRFRKRTCFPSSLTRNASILSYGSTLTPVR